MCVLLLALTNSMACAIIQRTVDISSVKKKKDAAAEFFTTNTIPLNSIILEHVEIF